MTDERIEAIKKREAAATKGPWLNAGYERGRGQTVAHGEHKFSLCQVYGAGSQSADISGRGSMSTDASFIAHSREDIPYLIAKVEELEQQLEASAEDSEALRLLRQNSLNLKHLSSDWLCWNVFPQIGKGNTPLEAVKAAIEKLEGEG